MQSQVPNGLAPGGLQVVANPVPAASDPVGVRTWLGANLPTANAQNPDQVTVTQTAQRAILSWQTFNVGQNTTLTFQQQLGGVAQPGWVVLNRVVGQLNPQTGLGDPGRGARPWPNSPGRSRPTERFSSSTRTGSCSGPPPR